MLKNGESGKEAAPELGDGVALEEISFGYQEGQEVLHGVSFRFDMGDPASVRQDIGVIPGPDSDGGNLRRADSHGGDRDCGISVDVSAD